MELTPYEINTRLKDQFNCKPKQMPRGRYLSFEVDVKYKTGKDKLFGIIPVTRYEYKKKTLYFDTGYDLTTTNFYGRTIEKSYIETALDLENEIVYWKYGS